MNRPRSLSWVGLFSLWCCSLVNGVTFEPRLIGGKPVGAGAFKEVFNITAEGAHCTATLVGKRVLLTAAHCARDGVAATFSVGGVNYTATMKRSPLYPGTTAQKHDIAAGLINQDVNGVEPVNIGGVAQTGLKVTLLGYGCSQPGGTDEADGVLRYGDSIVTDVQTFGMTSRQPSGAALCFGDDGGPTYIQDNGKFKLLGVNRKGDLKETNESIRLDNDATKNFLTDFAKQNNTDICGVTKSCGGSDPIPGAPTCTLAASPSSISLGSSLTLSFNAQGNVTSADIDGEAVTLPSAQKTVTPTSAGSFRAVATVRGPGGTGTCEANYSVTSVGPDPAPTCKINLSATTIKLGDSLVIGLTATGNATSATIDGVAVTVPVGNRTIIPSTSGLHETVGIVVGPGGQNVCRANYQVNGVTPPPPPPPPIGNFTLVPQFCGMNTVLETPVREVCIALVSFPASRADLGVRSALIINFSDTSKEVMPILHTRARPKSPTDLQEKEDWTLYGNTHVQTGTDLKLYTRTALMTKLTGSDAPTSLTGTSSNGQYFQIDSFQKVGP